MMKTKNKEHSLCFVLWSCSLCFIIECVLWSAVAFHEFVFVIDLVVFCICPLFMCSLVLLVVIVLWYCGTSVPK
jgi:hypothetical protein